MLVGILAEGTEMERLILEIDKTELYTTQQLKPGIYAPEHAEYEFELLIKMHNGDWCNIEGTNNFTPDKLKFYKIKKTVQ
jgi:hypothetical protein